MRKYCPKCNSPMHFLYGKFWYCYRCRIVKEKDL